MSDIEHPETSKDLADISPRRSISSLLANLPSDEMERLAPYLEIVEMHNGQTLLEFREPIDFVWMPHDAVTSTVVDTPEGTTIEVGLMGYEGLVGLSLIHGRTRSNSTVIVQIPGHGTRMSAVNFQKHVIEPQGTLYHRLLRYADDFMAMVAQTAACNSLHGIDERLSRWILMTHDRVQQNEMPLTQEFLAYMLGVRRATVSMSASGLQQMGMIRYSRGHLYVVDRVALENITCPCYRVVRAIMSSSDDDEQSRLRA